ncbi:MAG: 16S rRNA (guanine(527)-N(7))-methyltransferase RsmG [Bacteroidales bacterium]|nr:16S rRNA (guanine(527)-N(7))-methyltransferase RsmG [Bacteroidales bacterium]
MNFELIGSHFPSLAAGQLDQFRQLGILYPEWNAKINVISRQDIDNLYERHILHSLGIAKVITFKPGTRILDAGTGGGFPGIPLAILFPDVHFHLVDSTAKKLMVVREIASAAGIANITVQHQRLEEHLNKYDFVVSRAVASLDQMVDWVFKNIKKDGFNDMINGILYLKGMETGEEYNNRTIEQLNNRSGEVAGRRRIEYQNYPLGNYFSAPFFETKAVVHLF